MKTVSVELYTFDELSDSAKENARNWYRNLEDFSGVHQEVRETLKGFENQFNCSILNYEYGFGSHHARVSCDYYNSQEETVKEYIERHMPKGDYPFTGVCYDEDVLFLLKTKDLSIYSEVDALLKDCIEYLFDCVIKEMRYRLSDEVVDESLRDNSYEFTAEGKQYR